LDEFDDRMEAPQPSDSSASRWVFVGMIGLMAAGLIAYLALRRGIGPPPKEIAGDPLLVAGRAVYLSRCVSCHGPTGRGDGPIAKGLAGPPPRDFTSAHWKHGDRPDEALAVVSRGVPNTAMAGWFYALRPDEVKAVTAYVYHLGGRQVPAELRPR
jgi:cytochrome c oxidase cbb3-type subunit 3